MGVTDMGTRGGEMRDGVRAGRGKVNGDGIGMRIVRRKRELVMMLVVIGDEIEMAKETRQSGRRTQRRQHQHQRKHH